MRWTRLIALPGDERLVVHGGHGIAIIDPTRVGRSDGTVLQPLIPLPAVPAVAAAGAAVDPCTASASLPIEFVFPFDYE